jgi:hypothetical protein
MPLRFPPAPLAVRLVQQSADPNARARRDRFDLFDLVEDFEPHAMVLVEVGFPRPANDLAFSRAARATIPPSAASAATPG